MEFDWSQQTFVKKYNDVYSFGPKAIAEFLQPLFLGKADRFVDFGCGNGGVVKAASRKVKEVLGIDSSAHQVRLARAALKGRANARIIEATFLDCKLGKEPFTKAVARKALHHLTDAQKRRFFRRISSHFASGAMFLLEDGIFSFDRSDLRQRMPEVMAQAKVYYARKWQTIREDFVSCLRHEFPTGRTAWEESLNEGGFTVLRHWQRTMFYGTILAIKE